MSHTSVTPKTNRLLRSGVSLLAGFVLLTGLNTVSAQTAVTGVTYSATTNTTDKTAGDVTFLNQTKSVSTISSSLGNYNFTGAIADAVYIRRTTSANSSQNNSSAFYQYQSVDTSRNGSVNSADVYGKGDTTPTLSEVMLSNDLTQGLRNPFANVDSTGNSTLTNIERIDFSYSGGYTVKAGDALVFFDLENAGNYGDGFRIAAYTAVDANGNPTIYANKGLLVQPDSAGAPVATPTGGDATYLRLDTTGQGNSLASNQDITVLDSASNNTELYLVGVIIRFEDLGIAAGTVIQGFSLMAGDVAVNSASDLVNWNNSSVYKTNTDGGGDNWGNVDFMGFGGQISRPVPEPSTYGIILMSLMTGGFYLRRRYGKRK